MSYIGNQSQTAYSSLVKQDITGNGGSTYTLSHPVSSENDILLYINNVKQEGGVGKAFTATGTTLTLSENISSSDSCYVQYIGLAIQTTVPPDGSVSTAKIADDAVTSAKLDTNIAISGTLDVSGAFTSQGIDDNADATAITIDSSENVGIGTSSPSATLHVAGDSVANTFKLIANTTVSGSDATIFRPADNTMSFSTAGTERMRITSDGKICVNGTTTGGDMMKINNNGGSGYWALNLNSAGGSDKILISSQSGTGLVTHHQFNNSNGEVGTIKTLNSATHYNTSSDYRLKENVDYTFDATTRLKQLRPARFNFISDETNTLIDGFIAHEVSSIVPQAVMGEKDATETYTDDDGNEQTRISPQSIDHSKIVPLLVKTIQELEARITALENS